MKINISLFILSGPAPTDSWPVIIWLHSGDFIRGSPNDIDPFQIVLKQKVLLVTVAYRLNIFGFFTSMDRQSTGNYGLMDQSAAMDWVKRNIKLFDGNPKSVTLMGHGSGAISAALHLTSGMWSEDVFHKVIIMSPTSYFDYAVRDVKAYSSAIDQTAITFGCFRKPTTKMMDCLREVPSQTLNQGASEWGPVVDFGLRDDIPPFIRGHPKILIDQGLVRNVSMLIGYTDMEEALDIQMGFIMEDGVTDEMYQTLIEDVALNDLQSLEMNDTCGSNNKIVLDAINFVYKPFAQTTDTSELRRKYIDFHNERHYLAPIFHLAAAVSRTNVVYLYRFDIKPQTAAAIEGLPNWVTVIHRFDQIFVWGFPYWSKPKNTTIWDNADKRVTDLIMTMWMNFAKFSNPSEFGIYIKWDKFTPMNQNVLIIDRSFNMSNPSDINYIGIKFWNEYYEQIILFAMQCCNATSSASQIFSTYEINLEFKLLTQLIETLEKSIMSTPVSTMATTTTSTIPTTTIFKLNKLTLNIFMVSVFITISHAIYFLT